MVYIIIKGKTVVKIYFSAIVLSLPEKQYIFVIMNIVIYRIEF